jgi:hypothetical protein
MQLQPIVAEQLRTRLAVGSIVVSIIKCNIVRSIQILRAGQLSDLLTCDVIYSKRTTMATLLIQKASEFISAFFEDDLDDR